MLRITVFVIVAVALALAGPAVKRSKKDIEEFSKFLDDVRHGNRKPVVARTLSIATTEEHTNAEVLTNADELSHAEELSGYFQGDIVLDDTDYELMLQEFSLGRSAYVSSSILPWPENTVIFEFGAGEFDASQEAAIWNAIKDIEAHSCVKFRYREATDNIYVKITGVTNGCYSHIGYRVSRGAHTMNLGRNTVGVGCFRHATIVHEFMHILGFTHMHATFDRDDYVDIVEENVVSGSEHNFDVYTASRINNYDIEYDYVSCLHYSSTSFTKNGKPTIVPLKNYSGEMGQREYVTDSDWLRINRHYNCPGAWD